MTEPVHDPAGRGGPASGGTGAERTRRRGRWAAIVGGAAIAVVLALLLRPWTHRQGPGGSPESGGSRIELRPTGEIPRYEYEPPEPGSYALPALSPAGDGRVLDAQGNPVRLRDLMRDRVTILSFIYTRCADASACPMATGVLAGIHGESRRDARLARSLRLITFSFDPEHDTPSVMARYETAHRDRPGGAEWLFLTSASPSELEPILERYGQRVNRKPDPGDPLGPFYHLLRVYLIDREGMIRNIYSTGMLDPRLVLADVRTLLLEEEPGVKNP